MTHIKKITLFLCLLTLAACTTTQRQMDNAAWRMQRQKLESVSNWTISGKLAIITSEKKALHAFVGSNTEIITI